MGIDLKVGCGECVRRVRTRFGVDYCCWWGLCAFCVSVIRFMECLGFGFPVDVVIGIRFTTSRGTALFVGMKSKDLWVNGMKIESGERLNEIVWY